MSKANTSKLSVSHPELISQWHPTLNGDLAIDDVATWSQTRIWWQCAKADDHVWDATAAKRASGQGCAFCAGRRVTASNCLAATHPELASQWHKTRNGELTPQDLTAGSSKFVWWQCNQAEDHQWENRPGDRVNQGGGCPFCLGNRVALSTCLATTHPELASQWHKTRNGELTPQDLTAGSGHNVWWQCDKAEDHEWEAAPVTRKQHMTCPFCCNFRVAESNCMATTHPRLAAELHPTRNGDITAHDIVAGTGKVLWWRCGGLSQHEWQQSAGSRTRSGTYCRFCGHDNEIPTTHALAIEREHEPDSVETKLLAKHLHVVGERQHPVRQLRTTRLLETLQKTLEVASTRGVGCSFTRSKAVKRWY